MGWVAAGYLTVSPANLTWGASSVWDFLNWTSEVINTNQTIINTEIQKQQG